MTSHFLSLPTEIKIHIFSFLQPESLGNCAAVCKDWKNITSDNVIWKSALQKLYRKLSDQNVAYIQNIKIDSIKDFIKERTVSSFFYAFFRIHQFVNSLKCKERGFFRCISSGESKLDLEFGVGITQKVKKNVVIKNEFCIISEKFSEHRLQFHRVQTYPSEKGKNIFNPFFCYVRFFAYLPKTILFNEIESALKQIVLKKDFISQNSNTVRKRKRKDFE